MAEQQTEQSDPTNPELIPTTSVSWIFHCSEDYARALMRRLSIPRRGNGYSSRRILTALGFEVPVPLELLADETAQKALLIEGADLAAWLGESPRNVRRRLSESHGDSSFPQVLHLGPGKRLVFRAEFDAWLHGGAIPEHRVPDRVHTDLRKKAKKRSRAKTSRKGAEDTAGATDRHRDRSVTSLFDKPSSS